MNREQTLQSPYNQNLIYHKAIFWKVLICKTVSINFLLRFDVILFDFLPLTSMSKGFNFFHSCASYGLQKSKHQWKYCIVVHRPLQIKINSYGTIIFMELFTWLLKNLEPRFISKWIKISETQIKQMYILNSR